MIMSFDYDKAILQLIWNIFEKNPNRCKHNKRSHKVYRNYLKL
jgi:hypothetical protein